ncbi:DUF2867 domain-containing protein [Agrobacterium pusense]|uniref:DUF2867 domain-containing protein n=1 Tax=Agrobacterium pusense TaxID=648995 RepID=UPI003D12A58B
MASRRNSGSVTKIANSLAGSLIADWSKPAQFQDAYAVRIDRPLDGSMYDIIMPTLASPPGWLKGLFGLRDALVRPFGVRTTEAMRQAAHGRRIDFFRIQDETADEVVLGEDDWHLDFRVSIRRQRLPSGTLIVTTTAVRINNAFGRLYLFAIAPFHRLIVRASLRRMAASLDDRQANR